MELSKEWSEINDQLTRIEQKLDKLNNFKIIEEYHRPCDMECDISALERDIIMMKGKLGDLKLKLNSLERLYKNLSGKVDANVERKPSKQIANRKRKCAQQTTEIKKLKNEDVENKNC